MVIPCIRSIKVHLDTCSPQYNIKFVSSLKAAVDKRLSKFESSSTYQHASFLDPRVKLDWCTPDEAAAVKADITSLVNTHSSTSSTATDPACSPPRKKSRLFLFKASTPASTPAQNTEVDSYLAEPTLGEKEDPLSFWQQSTPKLTTLALLAEKYLHIPASSDPVERLFSVAGKILRPEWAWMSDRTFENSMFVKCNKAFK